MMKIKIKHVMILFFVFCIGRFGFLYAANKNECRGTLDDSPLYMHLDADAEPEKLVERVEASGAQNRDFNVYKKDKYLGELMFIKLCTLHYSKTGNAYFWTMGHVSVDEATVILSQIQGDKIVDLGHELTLWSDPESGFDRDEVLIGNPNDCVNDHKPSGQCQADQWASQHINALFAGKLSEQGLQRMFAFKS